MILTDSDREIPDGRGIDSAPLRMARLRSIGNIGKENNGENHTLPGMPPQTRLVDRPCRDSTDTVPETGRDVMLKYFGQRIVIGSEEAWLGRDGLAADWFDGNLCISRRHVCVRTDGAGRLLVGPDGSLNGTSYSLQGDNIRRPVGQGTPVALNPGDILWVYNIPLEVG